MWPYVGYMVANAAVAALLLASALFFWYQLLGRLLLATWSSGPVGMAATSVALGVMLLPVLWRLAQPARALAGRARFRLERRWRVRSIVILRDAATDLGDELRLGILPAGCGGSTSAAG